MNRFTLPAIIMAGLLLAPAHGKADETYTIKDKKSAKGDKAQISEHSTQKTEMKLEDGQGNVVIDKNETVAEKYQYQETVLEKPAEKTKPTQLRRSFEIAEATKGDTKQTLPYQGKTILIEKRPDRFHFQIEGGEELTAKEAEFLEKEFNHNKDDDFDFSKVLIPKKPVRVEESWELDKQELIADLEKSTGLDVDSSKAKATAKLLKAYKQDGKQFGVIQVHLDFPIHGLKAGEQKISLDPGAIDGGGCDHGRLHRRKFEQRDLEVLYAHSRPRRDCSRGHEIQNDPQVNI